MGKENRFTILAKGTRLVEALGFEHIFLSEDVLSALPVQPLPQTSAKEGEPVEGGFFVQSREGPHSNMLMARNFTLSYCASKVVRHRG